MSNPKTVTIPRWVYMTIVTGLAVSTVCHLFRIVTDFTR